MCLNLQLKQNMPLTLAMEGVLVLLVVEL